MTKFKVRRVALVPVAFLMVLVLVPAVLVPAISASSGAQHSRSVFSDAELALRFAPILRLDAQESFLPTDVAAMLDHSTLWAGDVKVGDPPVPEALLEAHDGPNASLRLSLEGRTPQQAYALFRAEYDLVVYAHVARGGSGEVVLQYWFFYLFNDGVNDHEGDWEAVQVHLNANLLPVAAAYSQHTTGRFRHWSEVPRDGHHPEVFVASGSHASYFAPGSHPVDVDACGLTGADSVAPGIVLRPDADYRLEVLANAPWLSFSGRWGAPGTFEFTSGSRGPVHRTNGCGASLWDDPWHWAETLPIERTGPWIATHDSPPVAGAGLDRSAYVGEAITFDGSSSRDVDGRIVSYVWDFGDGSSEEGEVVPHAYGTTGVFTVQLSVTDDLGQTDVDALRVRVASTPASGEGNITVLPGTSLIVSEDFESDLDGWTVSDENPTSGLDSWGTSTARAHSGNHSLWCAQEGFSSVNGQPNNQSGAYDQDMDANLLAALRDVSGYDLVTVSFSYWAVTGSFSLADFLSVWYLYEGTWVRAWSQPVVSSGGWQAVSVTIPNTSTALSFVFHSDPTAGLGPYEGVYVDDIAVTGTDVSPPESAVSALPPFLDERSVRIPYHASDGKGGSGFAYVTLHFRVDGGGWTPYPGTFDSNPIAFGAPSDGAFEFYTIAVDRSGNAEEDPLSADATTIVDTQAPSLAVTQPAASQWIASTTVSIAWSASDEGVGIDAFQVALDGGPFVDVGSSVSHVFPALGEGRHSVTVSAFDRVGHRTERSVGFGVDRTVPSVAILHPAAAAEVVDGNLLVTWEGSDSGSGVGRYEVRLDGGVFATVSQGTTFAFQGLANGAHTVIVRATDVAGNTGETSVSFRVNTSWLTGGGSAGWLPLAALILAVGIAMSLAVFLANRRRRRLDTPPPGVPERWLD